MMMSSGKLAPRASAIWWQDLERWSVKLQQQTSWQWPSIVIKPLSAALERRIEPVDKRHFAPEPQHFISLRFTGEVELRNLHGKSDFKGSLFFAYPGDLLYSKIDVRNGAIGIIPPRIPIAVVTNEFPVYQIKKNVALAEYIQLVFRTEHFRRVINGMVSGASGRKRVQPSDLERIQIPIPSLDTQQAIVTRWRQAQEQISAAHIRVLNLEAETQRQFLSDLGLILPTQRQTRKAFALRWNELERWGVAYVQQSNTGINLETGKYPIAHLRDVVSDLENGWSPKCLNRVAKEGEWGVLKLGAVSFGYFNDKENKALPSHLSPNPALEVIQGQVLISRANVTRLVGACALVNRTRPRLLLCDKIFRVVFLDPSPIDPSYLAEVMKIPQVRLQIEAAATGTSATMQNITKPSLMSLRLPLPPIDLQRDIVSRALLSRAEITRERAAVAILVNDINAQIESLVLGSKSYNGK